MIEYEVATYPADGDPKKLAATLNDMGAQGWMLAHVKDVMLAPRGGLVAAGQPRAIPGVLCVFFRPVPPEVARRHAAGGPEPEGPGVFGKDPGPAGERFREFQGGMK